MREISLERFAAAREEGATVLDVREPFEYVEGHVPGATAMPMSQLAARLDELDRGSTLYVICATGNRSLAMADLLAHQGFDAWSVAGGTLAWARSGRPVEQGHPRVRA